MKTNRLFKYFMIAVLMVGIAMIPTKAVEAANTTSVTIKADKKYTAYDITGDRKKDTFYIKTIPGKYDSYSTAVLSINGKAVWQVKNTRFYEMKAKLITLSNGKPFLYLYAVSDNGDGPVCGLFQYKSGNLRQVINFKTLFKDYGMHQNGDIVKLGKDRLTARFYVMSYSLGPSYVDYTYAYQSGTLKRTSTTGSFYYPTGKKTRALTVNKAMSAYKTAGSNTRAFTLKKGSRVTLGNCWVNGGRVYLQVKYNGKYGWVKALNKAPQNNNDKQFSNVQYAG